MNRIILKYFIYVSVFILTSYISQRVIIDYIGAAFLAGFVLFIVNILIKPLLLLIALPITLLTLGLFSFIVNACMILLADAMVKGITIKGFWIAVFMALLITVFNELLVKNRSSELVQLR